MYSLDKKGHEKILNSFTGTDGAVGNDALLQDGAGNLYGVTWYGDNNWVNGGYGSGGVYKLSKSNKETVLHKFAGGADGRFPSGALIQDKAGNFYGTTWGDVRCSQNCGTVFKLDARSKKLTTLYSFIGSGNPRGGVTRDANGNLYGAAEWAGPGPGEVYKLSPKGKLTALHQFTGRNDGAVPATNVILDGAGNLYGTASAGGRYGQGTVFKVSKSGKFTVLHTFSGTPDGAEPVGRIASDKNGNIYGSTALGGNSQECTSGCGTIWELTP